MTQPNYLTYPELLELINKKVDAYGEKSKLAKELGINYNMMCKMLKGDQNMSPRIFNHFGFSRQIVYIPISPSPKTPRLGKGLDLVDTSESTLSD